MTPCCPSLASPRFWRAYGVTLRPYLFFVSGASGLVGLAMADELRPDTFWIAFAALFCSYGFGQALTDVFQTDTDSISAPYRPLVRGQIARRHVFGVSLGGLGLCAIVLLALNPWTLVLSAAAVAGLVSYTPLKRRWWGGPLWNSWIVALLPVLGLLCGRPVELAAAGRLLLPGMASVFFSYAIFVLLGYFKDVEADRATGYQTLPVRYGRKVSVAVSVLLLAAAVTASGVLLLRGGALLREADPRWVAGAGLWCAGLVLLALAHVQIWATTRDEEAWRAIAQVVRGYVALHLGEATLLCPALAWPCLGLAALFQAALAARPCKEQI
jgi:4-hydroxybenzoate polyprenyltransferase